jgi:hypothetical protein
MLFDEITSKLETIITKIESFQGNHESAESIYISPTNMKTFATFLQDCEDFQEILITPYLVNLEDDSRCELLYYEFTLELQEIPLPYFMDYDPENTLPKEIINNIKPKAIAAKKNKKFLVDALSSYLDNMDKMSFSEVRCSDERLKFAKLFYHIF